MSIGNTRIDEFLKRRTLLRESDAWIKAFNSATKKQLISWVQQQLEVDGVDGKNRVLGQYSYSTQLITKGRKQQGDNYTLNDTGYFFNSMEVYVSEYLVEILGDGKKGNTNLYSKYGQFITTLTDENIIKLKEIIRAKYIDYIKKVLQLG